MLKVKDVMTKDVISVQYDISVKELADVLFENRINGVPVMDENNRLIGVVTERDLIDQTKKFHIPTIITFLDSVFMLDKGKKVEKEIQKMTGTTAQDICTRDPVTLSPETGLDEAATIMADKNVYTLPVIEKGELIGIVGKLDILKSITRAS
ncbi:MAG: CBS domain-containing protein [Thermodesulfobacteriota bacterium]